MDNECDRAPVRYKGASDFVGNYIYRHRSLTHNHGMCKYECNGYNM